MGRRGGDTRLLAFLLCRMRADQPGQPAAKAAIGFAGCRKTGAAVQLRTKERIPKGGGGDEEDQRVGVVAGDHSPRWGRGSAAGVRPVGDVAQDHLGPLGTTAGINSGEPSQPLREPVTEGIKDPVELVLERGFARRHRPDELRAELADGLSGQRSDEALAAAEMVKDQRMRYSGTGGDVLQPQPLGSGARYQALRRLQDQSARLLRRAAQPFDPPRSHFRYIGHY